mgnify:CR=1 FL=1
MNRIKKIFINIAVYVLIVGGTVFGLPKILAWSLGTSYPMAAITSGSMWPVLKEGDLVLIKAVTREEVGIGDIIVYRNKPNSGFTIHRVLRLDQDQIVTKGDANFNEDQPIVYESIVGRALTLGGKPLRLPYLGLITVLANKTYEGGQ